MVEGGGWMHSLMEVNIEEGVKESKKELFLAVQNLCAKENILCLLSYGEDLRAFISFDKENIEELLDKFRVVSAKFERKFDCSLNFPISRERKEVNGKIYLGNPVPNLLGSISICSTEFY